ncbi:arginase [uncultured Limnobacter sp.]|uniref:arginase n=1 Tax=uncultured Limnobacter sp. TaxID=199681 RepID=UPI0030F51029
MIALIGAPCDAGANTAGSALGPDALRRAGIQYSLQKTGCKVEDLGDLQVELPENDTVVQGYRNFHEVVAWNRAVHLAVASALKDGNVPVLLGGDHSLAMGSISAVSAHCRRVHKALRVVWLDAHADFNTASTSTTGNMHGMPLTALCGQGPPELTQLGGFCPALQASQIRLLGVRSIDPEEHRAVRRAALPIVTMRNIHGRGIVQAMNAALADIDPGTHVHVSFDVDCIDPSVLPGVSTPEEGGLQLNALHYCLARIAQTGCVASVDLVELNPLADPSGESAERAVELLSVLLNPDWERHVQRPFDWAEHAI